MNFIIEDVLNAIEKERPGMAGWCEEKRHELADQDKLKALRWVVFSLDQQNRAIASKTLGIALDDLPALGRVLQVL